MPLSRPGVKDVARHASVSAATVSRYLNGSLELPERTSVRIDRAVRELRYRPNPHARRLSLGRTDAFSLIVPNLTNPFFAGLAAGVEEGAAERGMSVTLHTTANDPDRELRALDAAARGLVDGLIFATDAPPLGEVATQLGRSPRAVVLDTFVAGAAIPQISCDNEMGGYLAGKHLRAAGHECVAYLGGGAELPSTRARCAGLRGALGEDATIDMRSGPCRRETGHDLIRDVLATGDATAVLIGSDEMALGALEALREDGVAVPGDLSIVSFDDVHPLSLLDPPLTAVRQPVRALGRRAVELLVDGDWGSDAFRRTVERMPVTLEPRGSVGAPNGFRPGRSRRDADRTSSVRPGRVQTGENA